MDYVRILKQLREDNGLTQNDVASILGISRGLYSQYEIADKIIPIQHLNNLSNYFGVSINYLLGFSNSKDNANKKELLDNSKIGIRLKEFRKENKLTQEKLANILHTTHSVISFYEKGKTLILTSLLCVICKKHNISADYLLCKIDNPKYLK